VYDALRGVDLIMHAGDLHDTIVLDWLEALAPVMAVSGNGDYGGWQRTEPPTDPRLRESRVLTLDSAQGQPLRIGLVHDFPLPAAPPERTLEGLMKHFFGGPVNVIVRGSTLAAEITTVKGGSSSTPAALGVVQLPDTGGGQGGLQGGTDGGWLPVSVATLAAGAIVALAAGWYAWRRRLR
jgi:hypothetical protein